MNEKFRGEKDPAPKSLDDQKYRELEVIMAEEDRIMAEIDNVLATTPERAEAEKIVLERWAPLMDEAMKKSGEAFNIWLDTMRKSSERGRKKLDDMEKETSAKDLARQILGDVIDPILDKRNEVNKQIISLLPELKRLAEWNIYLDQRQIPGLPETLRLIRRHTTNISPELSSLFEQLEYLLSEEKGFTKQFSQYISLNGLLRNTIENTSARITIQDILEELKNYPDLFEKYGKTF